MGEWIDGWLTYRPAVCWASGWLLVGWAAGWLLVGWAAGWLLVVWLVGWFCGQGES